MTPSETAPHVIVADYGLGNLKSVRGALGRAGAEVTVSGERSAFAEADGIVLPGVGAFGRGVENAEAIRSDLLAAIDDGTPTLGICLGLQLLLTDSEEAPGVRGFDRIPGTNRRFDGEVKVPHMGWNEIEVVRGHPLVSGLEGGYAYFVHSYYPDPVDDAAVVATTEHGVRFPSILADGSVLGTQFHPEKSGETGLAILRNFVSIVDETR
ncbi:MAG: imidazole glycerol phosphate synthase subunit HisH [Halobacteriota archaeon]